MTPTFRRPDLLRVALESALAQEFEDFELIVSDNEGSDAVAAIVAGYGDPRLRYRTNDGNIGALGNALAALREARGRYVTFLHDDDAWEPQYLARLVPALEADPTLALAYCDHYVMDAQGRRDHEATRVSTALWQRDRMPGGVQRPFVQQAIVDRSVPIAMASVIRRDAVDWDDFPAEIGTIYDIWLAYHASRDGRGAYYVPEKLTNYRVHGGAITSSTRYDRQFVFCYDRFLADSRLAPWREELQRVASTFRTGLALALVDEGGSRREALALLAGSLRTRPDRRAVGGVVVCILPRGALGAVRAARRRLVPVRAVRA